MASLPVVKDLDIFKDPCPVFLVSVVCPSMNALNLESVKETFSQGVLPIMYSSLTPQSFPLQYFSSTF